MLPFVVVCLFVLCAAVWVCDRGPIENHIRNGGPNEQYRLGKCYYYGLAVPASTTQAVKWFRLAAAQGHLEAQMALAMLYLRGEGLPQDYAVAARLLRYAAERGYSPAQNQLGILYAQGRGVHQDLEQANLWFSLATHAGNVPAGENLKLLAALRPPFMAKLTLRSGKALQAVRVLRVERDALTVSYQPYAGGVGMARLPFKDLPENLQIKYGYTQHVPTALAFDQLAVVTVHTF